MERLASGGRDGGSFLGRQRSAASPLRLRTLYDVFMILKVMKKRPASQ
jgi:hypothetical protein